MAKRRRESKEKEKEQYLGQKNCIYKIKNCLNAEKKNINKTME